MAKQRVVNTKFWDDTYVLKLDPVEKLLFLYFLTNPLTNISGIYEISMQRITFDTGIEKEKVLKIFQKFEKDKKMVYKNDFVYIINFIKNQISSPSVKEGILREISMVSPTILHDFDTLCPHLDTGCSRVWHDGVLNLTKLNLTKLNAFAKDFFKNKKSRAEETQEIKKKPFYNGMPMRQYFGKWQVFSRGEWLEFSGKEREIEYK